MGGTCNIAVSVTWDFELDSEEFSEEEINERNEQDTYYGEMAYEFYENNPNTPSVHLKIDIIASQVV